MTAVMEIPCAGGMLDGKTVRKDTPEQTIHQNGLWVLVVHSRYPKRAGWKTTDRLLVYTESYSLHVTEAGPVYRLDHNVTGPYIGDERLVPREGGWFEVWLDRRGTMHSTEPEG